jgi:hypothetical protein
MAAETNIVDLQRRDHEHLDELLQRYGTDDQTARPDTFRELVTLVTTHAFAEETVLFPAVRRIFGDGDGDAVTAGIEGEHQRINELLAELDGLEPGDEAFEARVNELFPLLRQDVRQEEVLLARLSSEVAEGQLRAVGAAWAAAKRTAPNRAHPGIPRRPPGNLLAGLPLSLLDHARGFLARLRGSSQ